MREVCHGEAMTTHALWRCPECNTDLRTEEDATECPHCGALLTVDQLLTTDDNRPEEFDEDHSFEILDDDDFDD